LWGFRFVANRKTQNQILESIERLSFTEHYSIQWIQFFILKASCLRYPNTRQCYPRFYNFLYKTILLIYVICCSKFSSYFCCMFLFKILLNFYLKIKEKQKKKVLKKNQDVHWNILTVTLMIFNHSMQIIINMKFKKDG
jgi:hypothetical protein